MDVNALDHLISVVRRSLIDDWTRSAIGKGIRTPDQLIVTQGLCSDHEAARRRAIELIVDDVVLQTIQALDGAATDLDLWDLYLERRALVLDDDDPYLELYGPALRQRITDAAPQELRRATAACLRLLPAWPSSASTERAVVEMLERGGGTTRDRRAVRRSLETRQGAVLRPSSEEELRQRDQLEAFILATEDDPTFALKMTAFRVIVGGPVDPRLVAEALDDALKER